MALEALSTNELFNLIIYDTFSATPLSHNGASETTNLAAAAVAPKPAPQDLGGGLDGCSSMPAWRRRHSVGGEMVTPQSRPQQNLAVQGGGRKKRRRRPKICKNKEEAETQRITHIAVERNRRKQMNEHLAVLRSLMPESYVQRVEEGCQLNSADEIAGAVHHMLRIIEEEDTLSTCQAV
nr:transcription factor bHLH71-like [Ipomoea batatas]